MAVVGSVYMDKDATELLEFLVQTHWHNWAVVVAVAVRLVQVKMVHYMAEVVQAHKMLTIQVEVVAHWHI